jgi:hypothetical protein
MRSAFDLVQPTKGYTNKSSQIFYGPGPFQVGQRTFWDKEDYRRSVENYLREAGVTEYQVFPKRKTSPDGYPLSGYEFCFKHLEDQENMHVCFLGDNPGHSWTTLGLADHLKPQIDTYVSAVREFMDNCCFNYQITDVCSNEGTMRIDFRGDLAMHVVARAHREGYIESMFMPDSAHRPEVPQIQNGLRFNI